MTREPDEKQIWQQVSDDLGKDSLALGPYFTFQISKNIRQFLFALSRYKFAARLLGEQPKLRVLELGCSEGLGTLMLAENAEQVTGVDFDEQSVGWAAATLTRPNLEFVCQDLLEFSRGGYDAVVSIDVIEHILPKNAPRFLDTVARNLTPSGFCVIGTPNETAKQYASTRSQMGHVNLYTAQRLKSELLERFHNVFLFGLNDEVVHTGFYPMCHYLMALACHARRPGE